MHHVDRRSPWEEIWQAFETLVGQGKVIYAGSSNFAGWHIAQAQETARSRHFMGLVSEQSLYNLMARTVELEVLPAARAYGLGVIPWSPLAGGLLGGVLRKERGGRSAQSAAQARLAEHRQALEEYERIADEIGENPANVGVAWLLHQQGVTAPIIGPRTLEQFQDSVRCRRYRPRRGRLVQARQAVSRSRRSRPGSVRLVEADTGGGRAVRDRGVRQARGARGCPGLPGRVGPRVVVTRCGAAGAPANRGEWSRPVQSPGCRPGRLSSTRPSISRGGPGS